MQKFYQPAIAVSNCHGHTELLHREQLPVGSPIRWVREQLGSQGAMAAGSHHVSAEHQLHTTLVYIKIVTHSLSACKGRMAATTVTIQTIQSYYIGSN